MKPLVLCGIVCAALTVAAWSGTAAAESGKKKLTTEKEFREMVAGKRMANKHGYGIAHRDGTITGTFAGKNMTGTWSWEDQYYCRTAKLGKKKYGHNCSVVTVSGNKVILKGSKGMGKKRTYRLEEPES